MAKLGIKKVNVQPRSDRNIGLLLALSFIILTSVIGIFFGVTRGQSETDAVADKATIYAELSKLVPGDTLYVRLESGVRTVDEMIVVQNVPRKKVVYLQRAETGFIMYVTSGKSTTYTQEPSSAPYYYADIYPPLTTTQWRARE